MNHRHPFRGGPGDHHDRPQHHHHGPPRHPPPPEPMERGIFTGRRPLRFLARQLQLNEQQFASVSRFLQEYKIARSLAEADLCKAHLLLGDALQKDGFSTANAEKSQHLQEQAWKTLSQAKIKAIKAIHSLLNEHQRELFAGLVRLSDPFVLE